MKRQVPYALGLLCATLATPAAAYCKFPPITFCNRCTLERPLEVSTNDSCVFDGWIHDGKFHGFQIVKRPKRGQFGIADPTHAAYRAGPKPGSDLFIYRVKWDFNGEPRVVTIVNRVTIVE